MPSVVNDNALVRGSITTVISGVTYTWLDYKQGAKARMEKDYSALGKPAGVSIAEDFEELTGTIRVRSDQVAPPKFTVFSYDGKNWFIYDREKSGSTVGMQDYAVSAIECVSGSVTIT
jgi:hypothetical protein